MTGDAAETARLAELVRTSPHLDAFTRAAWLELLPTLDAAMRARLATLLDGPPAVASSESQPLSPAPSEHATPSPSPES
ncbi:MAG: hypothetical protein NTZ05_11935 [Chloroflexi bacterium]|nr:hypothetical protein [Chloroflexota bacterium]